MSLEQNLEDLKRKHDEAWAAFKRHQYEVIEPRSYREKRGRKLEYVMPWRDLDERVAAENKGKLLYDVWDRLMKMYWELTGEHLPLKKHYVKEETPNGDRWRKVDY